MVAAMSRYWQSVVCLSVCLPVVCLSVTIVIVAKTVRDRPMVTTRHWWKVDIGLQNPTKKIDLG